MIRLHSCPCRGSMFCPILYHMESLSYEESGCTVLVRKGKYLLIFGSAMPPTPWSSSSSLVSDRLRPHAPPPKQQQQNKGKGKGKAPTPEPPKSKAVRVLEARLDGARGSNGRTKDPKGGCFCQGKSSCLPSGCPYARPWTSHTMTVYLLARNHALSSYLPMCRQCGLILCTLNPPYYACPHCAAPLLDAREREALVGRLEGELVEQMTKEEAARQKAIEEARAAEGAFPTLAGSQMARTPRAPTPTRTVLSLNSETKRVTVSSYSAPTVTSRPASRVEDREEEGRVSGPLGEVSCVAEALDPGRPWRNVRAEDLRYVPLPGGTAGDASKRGRRKGKERGTAGTRTDG